MSAYFTRDSLVYQFFVTLFYKGDTMGLVRILRIITLLFVLDLTTAVRRPPSIEVGPGNDTIFRSDSSVTLPCKATGSPEPNYEWFFNNKLMNMNAPNIQVSPDGGTITINPAVIFNQGYYQCKASNMYGASLSNTVRLQQAGLSRTGSTEIRDYAAKEGTSLTLECNPPKSVPDAIFSWELVDSIVDPSPQPFTLSKRVQIDKSGHLYFSHVVMGDAQQNKLYKCKVFNPYMDTSTGSSYSSIRVTDNPDLKDTAPKLLHSTKEGTVALLGKSLKIKCLFAGRPEPTITWTKQSPHGSIIAPNRVKYADFNTAIEISPVEESDEGTYTCQAINKVGSTRHSINIKVESIPVFTHKPVNTNKTNDEEVSLTCKANGEPAPKIQWLVNGVPFESQPGDKLKVSSDGKTLSIAGLCKSCPGGKSDLMGVQCNASNEHGYVFADAYLNVLERTNITLPPESLTLSPENATEASFDCETTSDDSTQVIVTWMLRNQRIYPDSDPRITLASNNTLNINLTGLDTKGLSHYSGRYTCYATNGYSSDSRSATLMFPGVKPPKELVDAGFPWWLIAVLLAILLFIILLIICCCCCCRRDKGDEYDVDEKERAMGNDPVKEMMIMDGFHVYNRPELGTLKRSRASLSSNPALDRSNHSYDESVEGYNENLNLSGYDL